MMADYVMVNGKPVALPVECESDMAARAAFITKATSAAPPPPAAEEKK